MTSADGFDSPVVGDDRIGIFSIHPADLDGGFMLTQGEIGAYGNARLRGVDWPLAPHPIPMSYLTQAGYLARSGGFYRLDLSAGDAPVWWVASTGNGPGMRPAAPASAPAGEIGRTVDGTRMTGRLRWGPFLDGQSGVFGYRLTAPAGFAGEVQVTGEMGADGRLVRTRGDSIIRLGDGPVRREALARLVGDRLRVQVWGAVGAVVVVGAGDAIDGDRWRTVTEFRISIPGQVWNLPGALVGDGGFLRVIVGPPEVN
jgi:hypothetical protein